MITTLASAERVQKCVFNFEIYRFLKKRPIYPILPYFIRERFSFTSKCMHGMIQTEAEYPRHSN